MLIVLKKQALTAVRCLQESPTVAAYTAEARKVVVAVNDSKRFQVRAPRAHGVPFAAARNACCSGLHLPTAVPNHGRARCVTQSLVHQARPLLDPTVATITSTRTYGCVPGSKHANGDEHNGGESCAVIVPSGVLQPHV